MTIRFINSSLVSLTPTNAANIQSAAKAVVLDSVTYWNHWWLPTGAPIAGFSQSISGKTVQFTNTSANATIYAWTFGDGATSALANPGHTYVNNGSYTVRLISKSACGYVDSMKKTIVINATAITNTSSFSVRPVVFPNPIQGILQLKDLGGAFTTLQLINGTGRLVKECTIPNGAQTFELNMQHLAADVYLLKLIGGNSRINLKVTKAE